MIRASRPEAVAMGRDDRRLIFRARKMLLRKRYAAVRVGAGSILLAPEIEQRCRDTGYPTVKSCLRLGS